MKYIVIQRFYTRSQWLIRVLESGDTEIMEKASDYYIDDQGEYIKDLFEYEEVEYFWGEWASKDLFQRVWIEDEQQNGNDVEMSEFFDFENAFSHLKMLQAQVDLLPLNRI